MTTITRKFANVDYTLLLSDNSFSKFMQAIIIMNYSDNFTRREIKILRKSRFFTLNVLNIVFENIPEIFDSLYITTDSKYFDIENPSENDDELTEGMFDKCIRDFENDEFFRDLEQKCEWEV